MFTTIFSRRGIRMGLSIPNLSLRVGAISSLYLSFSLAIYVLPGTLGDPDLLPRVREPVADPGRLPAARVHQLHVRDVHRGVEGVEPLLVVLRRPGVARALVDALDDDALLHAAARRRLLHGGDDHVPDPSAAALAAAEHADRQEAPGPRVVRDLYPGFLLDHYSALETMFARRQRLRAESGLVSMILTVSPTRASLPSSCTMKRLERLTRFLDIGWRTSVSTETVTVFSGLSETTSPTRSLRLPRSGSLWILPSSWSSAGPLAGPRSRPDSTVSPPSTRLSTASSGLSSLVSSGAWFLSSSTTIRSPASSVSGRSGAGRCSSGP